MASKIRTASVTDEVKTLVDSGVQVSNVLKTTQASDKSLKEQLVTVGVPLLEPGEKSVKLPGTTGDAVITNSESVKLEFTDHEVMKTFLKHLKRGDYLGAVDVTVTIPVHPKRLADLLKATVDFSDISIAYKVNAKELSKLTDDTEANKALQASLVRDTTTKVSYKDKENE